MAEVVIYTKSYCPFSQECKKFLEEKKIAYSEKVVDEDKDLEAEMKQKTGDRTDTPQVFINSHHIGSYDDLRALDDTDKLNELLKGNE